MVADTWCHNKWSLSSKVPIQRKLAINFFSWKTSKICFDKAKIKNFYFYFYFSYTQTKLFTDISYKHPRIFSRLIICTLLSGFVCICSVNTKICTMYCKCHMLNQGTRVVTLPGRNVPAKIFRFRRIIKVILKVIMQAKVRHTENVSAIYYSYLRSLASLFKTGVQPLPFTWVPVAKW